MPDSDQNLEESKRILDRVNRETETVGTSSMRRVANQVRDHIGAEDADENEWAELWGTRIGRVLSIVFFVVLVVYLARTYVFI